MNKRTTRSRSRSPFLRTALALGIVGCNSSDVEPGDIDQLTDGGLGDTGGGTEEGGGGNPSVCWDHEAPAGAVRWQCEGLAEAQIFFTLSLDSLPDWLEIPADIQQIIDGGQLGWNENFGPWDGESYDEPGINACCLPGVGGDEQEGEDETGAGSPEHVPQPAIACTNDCADEACRAISRTLRLTADELPLGSYRKQLEDLADWVAAHQQECWHAMTDGDILEGPGNYIINGEWQIPDSGDWPSLTGLSVDGRCKVYDWYLPEQGEPHACTGINDNNDEEPFGSGGALGGFDTFAPTGGEMELDGPVVFGVHAKGSAPVLGLGDGCPRGECSRMDAWITEDAFELQRLVLMAPPSMTWEQDGMRLTVDDLHAIVEHPRLIPLVADGDVMRFEIPAGELELLFAGQVHGVPVAKTVPNITSITGSVDELLDGSHTVVFDPFTVEHRDDYGSWMMHVDLGEMIALDHSPRATFSVRDSSGTPVVDASASFDPDGDPLAFEWFLDGASVGEGPELTPVLPAGLSTLSVRVTDDTGRSSWSYGLLGRED